MNHQPTVPEPEKVKQTLARARRSCQELELAGIQLEEVISRLERDNLNRRKQQLGKVLQNLDS
jgi:hypothetical protein